MPAGHSSNDVPISPAKGLEASSHEPNRGAHLAARCRHRPPITEVKTAMSSSLSVGGQTPQYHQPPLDNTSQLGNTNKQTHSRELDGIGFGNVQIKNVQFGGSKTVVNEPPKSSPGGDSGDWRMAIDNLKNFFSQMFGKSHGSSEGKPIKPADATAGFQEPARKDDAPDLVGKSPPQPNDISKLGISENVQLGGSKTVVHEPPKSSPGGDSVDWRKSVDNLENFFSQMFGKSHGSSEGKPIKPADATPGFQEPARKDDASDPVVKSSP